MNRTKPRPRDWYAKRAAEVAAAKPCAESMWCRMAAVTGGAYCSRHSCTYGGCKAMATRGNRCSRHVERDDDLTYEEKRYGR